MHKLLKEMNGYYSGRSDKHLAGFRRAQRRRLDDLRVVDLLRRLSGARQEPCRQQQPDPPGQPRRALELGLGVAGESAAAVQPRLGRSSREAVERTKEMGVVGRSRSGRGYDVPDFAVTKAPTAKAKPGGIGLDALSGTDPFIMKPDGVGWLYVPTGLVDGPLPTHYEPLESPVPTALQAAIEPGAQVLERSRQSARRRRRSEVPVRDHHVPAHRTLPGRRDEPLAAVAHRAAAGAVRRDQPRAGAGKRHPESRLGDESRARARQVRAKALVTRRMRPLQIDGKTIHHVGMPWHWGYEGLVTGDVVNELTSLVGDPNVSIHEGKAFVCNVEKA